MGRVATKLIVSGATLFLVAFATPAFADTQIFLSTTSCDIQPYPGSVTTGTFSGVYSAYTPGSNTALSANEIAGGSGSGGMYNITFAGDGTYYYLSTDNGSPSRTVYQYGIVYKSGSVCTTSVPSSGQFSVVQPLAGSVSTSTHVIFEYEFLSSSPQYDFAGYELRDLSAGSQSVGVEEPILSSGVLTYYQTDDLTAGHAYSWRPYLRSASSSPVFGDWIGIFNVVTQSASSTPYFPPALTASTTSYLSSFCSGFGSSTDAIYTSSGFSYSICYAGGFLFVPSNESVQQFTQFPLLLQSKFPFSYFYDIKNIVSSATETETPIGVLTVDLPLAGETVFFSSSTLTTFITPTASNAIRPIASGALWLLAAYGWYRMVLGVFKHKH